MVLAQLSMKTLALAWLKKAFSKPGKLSFIMVLAMMLSGFAPTLSAKNVLFISDYDLGSLNSGDQAIYNRLITLGHTVTIKGSNANPASTSDATGQDFVLISSTINSGDINTMFRDVPIPVIVCEPWLLDDMKMVYNDGNQQGGWTGQTQMTIDMPSHPLAAGLSGDITVLSPSENLRFGTPNLNGDKIARLYGSTDNYGIFCYHPGAWMEGMYAPAMRIGFFLDNNTAAYLTNDGWTLFDNCINMCAGGPVGPPPAVVGTCDILDYGTSGRSFWIPLPGHNNGDEKLYTFISGGQLVEYSDGSAVISGVIENLDDPSFKWDVYMRFIGKKNWTEWSALGRQAKGPSLGDETTWTFYEMDGTSSRMFGIGGFAGDTLYLSNNPTTYIYGLQIGDGANDKNSAFGMSQWFKFHGSYNGHGDINAEANCTDCDISDGGQVGPDQENCGPYDPDPIPSITPASGGSGTIEYEWFYSLDKNLPFEMWVPEPNSNSETYDPHFIDKTCWLVRCARIAGCDSVVYSNIVAVKVKEFPKAEFVVPGAVCNDSLVTITAATANGDTVAYSWTFENGNPASATGQSVQVKWPVGGDYDITLSVNRFDCVSDLTQPIMIDNCVICDNITGGGSINGGDATCVIPYDPASTDQQQLAQHRLWHPGVCLAHDH